MGIKKTKLTEKYHKRLNQRNFYCSREKKDMSQVRQTVSDPNTSPLLPPAPLPPPLSQPPAPLRPPLSQPPAPLRPPLSQPPAPPLSSAFYIVLGVILIVVVGFVLFMGSEYYKGKGGPKVISVENIKKESKSFVNPHGRGNLLIKINHLDIHPSGEGTITWTYEDGTTETITAQGNGGTRFKNSSGLWTDPIDSLCVHTDTISNHTELSKRYTFAKIRGDPLNSWMFETLDGGVTQVMISHTGDWEGWVGASLIWE